MASIDEQTRQACQLFEDFQKRAPRWDSEIVKVGDLAAPTVALAIGRFVGISYKKLGDGKLYYHDFSKSNPPQIFFNAAGNQIYIHGGGYKLTERGIVG